MSTSADMTVANNYGAPVTCAVSGVDCMLENGDGGSHLEQFNRKFDPSQSLRQTVATDASGACDKSQSRFTLDFAKEGGDPLGSVTLELGRGHFKTGVVANTAPWVLTAATWGKGRKRHISVEVLPGAEALVNSWLWANMPAMEKQIKLPPVTILGFEFDSATVSGLETLRCTAATVGGDAANGVTAKLRLEAAELRTHGKVGIPHIVKVGGGLTLESAKLSAAASVRLTAEGKVLIQVLDLTLDSTAVRAKVAGIELPSHTLSVLAKAVEAAVSHGAINDYIIKKINKRLRGHNKGDEAEASS